jgi:hypothetical protein
MVLLAGAVEDRPSDPLAGKSPELHPRPAIVLVRCLKEPHLAETQKVAELHLRLAGGHPRNECLEPVLVIHHQFVPPIHYNAPWHGLKEKKNTRTCSELQ